MSDIEQIVGKIIVKITGGNVGDEKILFECSDQTTFKMYHFQDCCENVQVDQIVGDINNILHSPVLSAEESNPDRPIIDDIYNESFTWTDFTITTEKGTVVFQWLGCSNGYYGETPQFELVK